MPIKDKKANERVRDRPRDRETTDSQSSLNGQTNRHTYTHTHTTLAGTYRSNRFHPSGRLTAKCERWLKWGGGRGKEWDWHWVWLWCRPRSPTAFCSLLFPPLSVFLSLFGHWDFCFHCLRLTRALENIIYISSTHPWLLFPHFPHTWKAFTFFIRTLLSYFYSLATSIDVVVYFSVCIAFFPQFLIKIYIYVFYYLFMPSFCLSCSTIMQYPTYPLHFPCGNPLIFGWH